MEIEKLILNNNIINEIEKDQINPISDIKEIQKKEMIDMLQNILKKQLDSRLLNLEKKSKNQLLILKNTSSSTKYITDLSIKMNKEIREKKLQNKRLKFSKIQKFSKVNYSQNRFMTKYSDNFSKSPLRINSNRGGIFKTPNRNNILLQRMKSDAKNKTPYLFSQKRKITVDDLVIKSPFSFKGIQLNSLNKENNNYTLTNHSSSKKLVTYRKKSSTNVNRKKKINTRININCEDLVKKSVMSNDTYVTSESSKSSIFLTKKNSSSKNYKFKSDRKNNNKDKSPNRKSPLKKNIGLIGRMKKNLNKSSEKCSPLKKKNIIKQNDIIEDIKKSETDYKNKDKNLRKSSKKKLMTNNNISIYNYSSKNSIESNIGNEKIIRLETNLENEEKIINNDPLLVSSLKELDFVPKDLISNHLLKDDISFNIHKNKDLIINQKYNIIQKQLSFNNEYSFYKYENSIFDDHLNDILIFLTNKDILEFKNCSKTLHKLVIEYLIKQFDTERNIFISKQNELNLSIEDIQQKPSINDLKFSKGAYRAINLLNEDMLNKLFVEEKKPNDEIYIIYKIYFQLINYTDFFKYINESNNDEFWEKCKLYFRELNGKTGDLLSNIITQKKIVLSGENIYKVYKLANKHINKIVPAYYSKICATTGLFVFFIKDILDFLGFSHDKIIQKNAYWSYSEIINLIDSKINILNKYQVY